jgi:bifunctional non-homologous end joining protein LigD
MTPNIFVVQEHHSEGRAGLHWDFRLQVGEALRSWVLRKPPPVVTGVTHLAIPVNDHPLSWATFTGRIVEGYGRGSVLIWDTGAMIWEAMDDQLIFILYGEKLTGKYVLIPLKENYLLYKSN